MLEKLPLPDPHFALFGCKIAQGLAELHLDLSPVAATLDTLAAAAPPPVPKKAGGKGRPKKKLGDLRIQVSVTFLGLILACSWSESE
jgi:hypothetical protein